MMKKINDAAIKAVKDEVSLCRFCHAHEGVPHYRCLNGVNE